MLILAGTCARAQAYDAKPLQIIEQDYERARQVAEREGKLLFIDFYTDWCGPCKQLDKLVFRNDSLTELLAERVVLLRYDAENDTVFHLSKKHHVNSYPTGLILNRAGRVVNRKYGFPGNSAVELGNSVLEFVSESEEMIREGTYLTGYSASIDPTAYPSFYVDYVNRTNTRLRAEEIDAYFRAADDLSAEKYATPLLYFAGQVPDDIADAVLVQKDRYLQLYGKLDTEILIYYLVSGRFRRAIASKDPAHYAAALSFAKAHMSQDWLDDILPSVELDYLKAQGKWDEVFATYRAMKENGEMDNGYVNHFSYQVYKECNDPRVIADCTAWMKEVVSEEPTFDYLDTYAFLLYKGGDYATAKEVARRAIEAGREEDRKTSGLEKLIAKIEADKK
jgi:thiol-disulfide isomerase/thioredoxin